MTLTRRGFLGAAAMVAIPTGHAVAAPTRTLYLGTYTSPAGGGSGIGIASYDATVKTTATGTLTGVEETAKALR